MRIRHNIMAMNAKRNYEKNTSGLSKTLEKLSSGYQINRAADDAAGLAISEKMRAQITGLNQAQDNAKDGISLVQTAEGALTEVHDMLNRMTELATQSANGIYEGADRAQIQKEFERLMEEIDRIATSANFNGRELLNGDLDGATVVGIPPVSGLNLTYVPAVVQEFAMHEPFTANTTGFQEGDTLEVRIEYKDTNGQAKEVTLTARYSEQNNALYDTKGNQLVASTGSNGTFLTTELASAFERLASDELGNLFQVESYASGKLQFLSKVQNVNLQIEDMYINWNERGISADVNKILSSKAQKDQSYQFIIFNSSYNLGDVFSILDKRFAFVKTQAEADALGSNVNTIVVTNGTSVRGPDVLNMSRLIKQKTGYEPYASEINTRMEFRAMDYSKKGLILQIGDTSDDFNQLEVTINSVKKDDLKDLTEGTGLVLSDLSVETADNAMIAMGALRGMINYVSDIRGYLGAVQNRLEHTVTNLSVMEENIQDAESSIRDTDIADEMMVYTKNNILIQSAQVMLAQANQVPQGVLQLLQ